MSDGPDTEPVAEDLETPSDLGEAASAELVEEDLDELGLLAKERDEFREAAQRLQADFENYRKRVARQSEELQARLAADIITSLLPVLDTLELAEAHLSGDGEPSMETTALRQARSLLVDTLAKQGLEAVAGAGAPFDPTVHDAVAHAADEEEADGPVVDEVLRSGYSLRGTVVRPAMVRVRG